MNRSKECRDCRLVFEEKINFLKLQISKLRKKVVKYENRIGGRIE